MPKKLLELVNKFDHPITVRLEPEGFCHEMQPGSKVEILKLEDEGIVSIDFGQASQIGIHISLWPIDCEVAIIEDGEEVFWQSNNPKSTTFEWSIVQLAAMRY